MVATKAKKKFVYRAVIAYVPVIHQGYLDFFKLTKPKQIWLIGRDFTDQFRPLQKDIRALEPKLIASQLQLLLPGCRVGVWSVARPPNLAVSSITLPNEEVSRAFASQYLSGYKLKFASVFLRWDKSRSLKQQSIEADHQISAQEFDQQMIKRAQKLADKSSDWWRQVGAVLVKDGQVLIKGYNKHLPGDQQAYIDGDPRADYQSGEAIHLSSSIHTEAGLVAQAAKQGIALDGASLYVTTFPCPVCAKLVAAAGIKKLYYQDGYSVLDGERVLKASEVEIIQVRRLAQSF